MKRAKAVLGYTAAVLTAVGAVLTPFLLINLFTKGFAATGVKVDEYYVGAPVERSISRDGYRIDIHRPVHRRAWQRGESFVQLSWSPVKALPPKVSEVIDVDNDGRPDVRISFAVPQDEQAPVVDAEPLDGRFRALHGVRKESFAALIARVNDRIIVRVPLK